MPLSPRNANGGEDDTHNHQEVFDGNAQSIKCTSVVDQVPHITDFWKFGPLFWLLTLSCFVVYGCVLPFNNVASGILLERNFFASSPGKCTLEHPAECTQGYILSNNTAQNNNALDATGAVCSSAPSQAPVLPSSVNHASSDSERSSEWEEATYRYSSLTSNNVDCGDSFWLDAYTSDYCQKQRAATEQAGRVMSIPYLILALSLPPLGHLVDRIGRRAQIAVLFSSLLFVVHLTLALSASSPIGPLVGQGIAYSLYVLVIWPSVPLTVHQQYTGTAFGVMTSIQNMGLALFPLVIAAIYNASGGRYIPNVEFLFVCFALAGIVTEFFLNKLDPRYGHKLNTATAAEDEEIVTDDIGREDGDVGFASLDTGGDYFSPLLHDGL